ncbi:MAG: N-acetylmuramoyl-L-alanine amidase [Proteobacteria bacterium]|nr:N-acetylmuramoyl-L-alanine amidase [Pseudomonadota bacterium]
MGIRISLISVIFVIAGMFCTSVQAEPWHNMRHEAKGITSPKTIRTENSEESVKTAPIDVTAEKPDETAPDIHPGPVRLIVIDPGHGGTNEGAIGVAKIHEKHLTLLVALLLADRLRKALPETKIVLTRHRDQALSLNERIGIANRLNADLFLSLHFNNSNNLDAIGFESFWAGDYWEGDYQRDGIEITDEIRAQHVRTGALSEKMAHCFNRAMRHRFDVLDRGVRTGDYTVLTQAQVPSVVLEMGFLSNAKEGLNLVKPEHRAKMVNALVDAVVQYTKM